MDVITIVCLCKEDESSTFFNNQTTFFILEFLKKKKKFGDGRQLCSYTPPISIAVCLHLEFYFYFFKIPDTLKLISFGWYIFSFLSPTQKMDNFFSSFI
jgi:hypothetical protein